MTHANGERNDPPIVAITGASAGIGRAVALRFAREGAAVALCARREAKLVEAAAAVEQQGGRALPVVADVTDPEAMRTFLARTVAQFGRLDAIVCNAGFGIYGTVDVIEPSQMRRLMDVNFMGTYHAIRLALPEFRRLGRGHVFVISSIVGRRGIPFMGAYAATKFAQVGLAESLRAELRGSGVHLSVVYPIATDTEFMSVMRRESGFATRARGPRQSADVVAHAIVRAFGKPVAEIYPYRPSKTLAVLGALAPSLCDRIVHMWRRAPIAASSGSESV
ncbi:MAG: SDR family NAD(P)-dependent oxidoreductase [Acidimicrobiia bacterium]|nr:SDR family NAD(P)-dependent oxidoreductase [Acidimicrobiia bacterium]